MFAEGDSPLLVNEVAAKPGLRRGVAEAELHAELLGDVAGNLGDRGLDQHLRPPLVELGDQLRRGRTAPRPAPGSPRR